MFVSFYVTIYVLPNHLYLIITIWWRISESVTFLFMRPYKGLKFSLMKLQKPCNWIRTDSYDYGFLWSSGINCWQGKAKRSLKSFPVSNYCSICALICVFWHLCSLWVIVDVGDVLVRVGYFDANNGFKLLQNCLSILHFWVLRVFFFEWISRQRSGLLKRLFFWASAWFSWNF